jgi:hypothetical protein
MEIAFPINKLIREGLTPDEFSICMLLDQGKTGLLRELAKLKGESFYENLKRLNNLNYIEYNTIGNIVSIKDITLKEDFKKLIAFDDPFVELYNKYPVRANRPNGGMDYLRQNKNKCKIKYAKLLKNNPLLHAHILACLSVEKKERQQKGTLGYFKRMYNWLESREWEKYEDKLKEFTETTISPEINNVEYGEKLL